MNLNITQILQIMFNNLYKLYRFYVYIMLK